MYFSKKYKRLLNKSVGFLKLLVVVSSGPVHALIRSNSTGEENHLDRNNDFLSPTVCCRLNQDTSFSENMEEKSLVLLKCTNNIRFPLNLLEKLEEKKKDKKR